jgi:7-carboxy-7-deazaguanine synthase
MFGMNQTVKQDLEKQTLTVKSIFYTIQGEGPFTGEPAVFVRLGGCNLKCWFCDTDFTTDLSEMSYEEVANTILGLAGDVCRFVVITGGEPLLQPLSPLVAMMAEVGFHTQIETAGTVWDPALASSVMVGDLSIVVSPKTGTVHEGIHQNAEYWKYIIREGDVLDKEDGLPMMSTQVAGLKQRIARPAQAQPVIFVQPCDEYLSQIEGLEHLAKADPIRDEAKNAANMKLAVAIAMTFGYKLSLQVHKIAGLE